MSLHFAPSRAAHRSPVAQFLAKQARARAANDNGEVFANGELVEAALRHFAEYGLGAAQVARQRAEAAFFDGKRQDYDWWLGICRTLDRRIADSFERRVR